MKTVLIKRKNGIHSIQRDEVPEIQFLKLIIGFQLVNSRLDKQFLVPVEIIIRQKWLSPLSVACIACEEAWRESACLLLPLIAVTSSQRGPGRSPTENGLDAFSA